jgi:hypothetical protein
MTSIPTTHDKKDEDDWLSLQAEAGAEMGRQAINGKQQK